MLEFAKEVSSITIEEELKQSYLGYAMSVIVGRALPDVRDGLKPVHRRVLYAMSELGNDWNKPYKKSARIVGDVIGKYHPHGDVAVYDTMVRMAQSFSMRYLLVEGQGNFGSVDGDSPAAMRYTEVRMSQMAHALLADLDKETVDFVPNYDGNEMIPVVLPTRVPNLLVNGSSGIAVGMATNIPPHQLNEIIDACEALLDNPDLDIDDLMEYVKGPDFPTKGIIYGRNGIVHAYRTGRGRVHIRARIHIETDEKNGKQSIIATELPYQVNKARLIEKIAELVKEKKLEGITGLRDESDKDGMRVVVELRRGEVADVVINNLYAHTQMQVVFGINMVALVDGQPRVLNLKQILEAFLKHRREVITRRTIYELRKAKERAHVLEGLGIALANIEPIIALIKSSKNPAEAKERLIATQWILGQVIDMLDRTDKDISRPDAIGAEFGFHDDTYRLSPEQAQAILELRLHRLTGLEQDKIFGEYKELLMKIREYIAILGDSEILKQVARKEFHEIKAQFGDQRLTEIIANAQDFSDEDLIPEETEVVTLSHEGYIKRQSLDVYQAQRRGGRGKSATAIKEEDFIDKLLVASTHDTILCFSSIGKVYWLKVYQLPEAGRQSRGRPIVNLLPLVDNEKITSILPVREFEENKFIFMATQRGIVKKVSLERFSKRRSQGIVAINLDDEDRLVGVSITDGNQDVMLFSNAGKVIRFNETKVRDVGRTARGVRGMTLQENQQVISLIIARDTGSILTATENGYGKRTSIEEYRITSRGGQGVISIQVSERNGQVVGASQVDDADEMMLITDGGTLVRTRVKEVSLLGRNTQGVTLIRLTDGEKLVGLQRIAEIDIVDTSMDDLPETEEA